MLLKREVKDPRISESVCISRIETSRDLRYAKVYVVNYDIKVNMTDSVEALNHAAGFMQSLLGKRITIRHVPRLTFILDAGLEAGFRMTQKLKDLEIHDPE